LRAKEPEHLVPLWPRRQKQVWEGATDGKVRKGVEVAEEQLYVWLTRSVKMIVIMKTVVVLTGGW